MEDIIISRVVIHSNGDRSVGIFPATWFMEGPINIDSDDIEFFKQKISEAWEVIAEDADVTIELQAHCIECGKSSAVIQPPDQYEGWCLECVSRAAAGVLDTMNQHIANLRSEKKAETFGQGAG